MSSQLACNVSATAFLSSNSGVRGTINFSEPVTHPKSPVSIKGDIDVLASGSHALTINYNGDISKGGYATGPVFFPLQAITAENGTAKVDQKHDQISLNDIIGKSLVVYKGSTPNSDAIAWAVIGSVEPSNPK